MENRLSYKIKEIRKLRDLTQSDLAKTLGITTSAVGLWETEKAQPKLEFLVKICEVYDIEQDWLILGKGDIIKKQVNIVSEAKQIESGESWKDQMIEEVRAIKEKMQEEINFLREQLREKDTTIHELTAILGKQ